MNKSQTSQSLRHSTEIPSISALDNNASFDVTLQFRQNQNLREVPLHITETPRKNVLKHSPIKNKDPITSATKKHHRKNSQLENFIQESPVSLNYPPMTNNYIPPAYKNPSPSKVTGNPCKTNNRYSSHQSKHQSPLKQSSHKKH